MIPVAVAAGLVALALALPAAFAAHVLREAWREYR